ncbi:hypothetical protein pipiens_007652 [Culex pipiens pipiens]|uniref:Uncharacterized protein n=1 Tax=Culex pipiens pipiens TaxID=38569 RepID=A0ABD1DKC3_CULPP
MVVATDCWELSAHCRFRSTTPPVVVTLPGSTTVAPGTGGGADLGGQIPLERLPSNTLLKYTAYKDVSILHFHIPADTRTAFFSFKAYEESKSAFQRVCQPNDITLHLKAGSYPVISPENITFPKHFLSADERFEIHNLQFKSDSVTRRLSIDGPHPGNWFAVAFISCQDRPQQRAHRAARVGPVLRDAAHVRDGRDAHRADDPERAEFPPGDAAHQPDRTDELQAVRTEPDGRAGRRGRAAATGRRAPPMPWQTPGSPRQSSRRQTHTDRLQNGIICPNQTGELSIEFYPQESAWHYVDLDFLGEEEGGNRSSNETASGRVQELEYVIELEYHSVKKEGEEEDSVGEAARTGRRIGEFSWLATISLPDINGTVPLTLNLSAGTPALMKFDVNDVYDIGGTLSFAIAMRPDQKGALIDAHQANSNDHVGVVAEKLIDVQEGRSSWKRTTATTDTVYAPGLTLLRARACAFESEVVPGPTRSVCGRLDLPGRDQHINTVTDMDTSTGLVHVPFPEPGKWYVTMGIFCHGAETAARVTIIDSVKEFIKKYREILLDMKPPCSCATAAKYCSLSRRRQCSGEEAWVQGWA